MTDEERLAATGRLVELSRADWAYADLYLRDAEKALAPLCDAGGYRALLAARARGERLRDEMRVAVERAEWSRVRELAREAAAARRHAAEGERLLDTARAVHGPRALAADSAALVLHGVLEHPVAALRAAVARLAYALRELAASGLVEGAPYLRRAERLEALAPDPVDHAPAASMDPAALLAEALRAVASADFDAVERLAARAAEARSGRFGRIRAPLPAAGWVEQLAERFRNGAVERAAHLGLEPAEAPARAELNAYLSCVCGDRPLLPASPRGPERRAPEACTCGHACPPGVGPALKSSLDALMVHPFVSSAGTRYLPWFGREAALVEGFPEEEADFSAARCSASSASSTGAACRGGRSRKPCCATGRGSAKRSGSIPGSTAWSASLSISTCASPRSGAGAAASCGRTSTATR
jgi:hypothetical protein